MAEITLRSYSQEIDGLIELDRLDEAIAHCRQVLQAFPKHLDTYRLLGKAYLEAKRYGDASDIFKRVLSSEPADFVSHIGMSVISEDAGNLDAAIWHMERAFENNPANQVIQQELKRLFGERDGSEPMKIRLTRGALARMYANGELYPQAIAELRAALDEDPERPDLQLLLAEMYWQMNQQLDAAEICSRLLDKLPHCREANRIMAAVLQAGGKSEAAGVYLRRLAAIDPYTAFLESQSQDVDRVDAESVTLERLEWQAGDDLAEFVRSKPDWATSLGSDLSAEEQIPEDSLSWSQVLKTFPASDEFSSDLPDTHALETEDSSIPEWLRDGGWNEATGEAVEERIAFSDDELARLEAGIPADGDLARAEIPDWLKDIAPVGLTDPDAPAPAAPTPAAPTPAETSPKTGERALPEWLQGIADDVRREEGVVAPTPPFEDVQEEEPEEEIPRAEEPPEPVGDGRRQLPTWLEDSEPGGGETILTWLGSRAEAETPEIPIKEGSFFGEPAEESDTSSWLSGVAEAAAQEPAREDAPSSPHPEDDAEEMLFDPTTAVTRELSPEMLEKFAKSRPAKEVHAEEPTESARWQPEFDVEEAAASTPQASSPTDDTISDTLAGEGIEWLETLALGRKKPDEPASPDDEPEVPTWLRKLAEDTGELEAAETLVMQDPERAVERDTRSTDIEATPEDAEPMAEPQTSTTATPPDAAQLEHVAPFVKETPASEETAKRPKPPSTHRLTTDEIAAKLENARMALEDGDVQRAADEYIALIRAKAQLNDVIDSLQRALQRYPDTPILWQVLGDAHMKADRLSDAMDAYRQGLDTI